MRLTVNGKLLELDGGPTVSTLLEHLKIGRERVAVEVNLEIVPKATYETHLLQTDDKIEIVQFVGGG